MIDGCDLRFATLHYQAPGIIPAGPKRCYREALGNKTGMS